MDIITDKQSVQAWYNLCLIDGSLSDMSNKISQRLGKILLPIPFYIGIHVYYFCLSTTRISIFSEHFVCLFVVDVSTYNRLSVIYPVCYWEGCNHIISVRIIIIIKNTCICGFQVSRTNAPLGQKPPWQKAPQ
jgi:hypothetical protein